MPWTWGDTSSVVEKAKTHEAPLRWQAEYLKKRMVDGEDRFDTRGLPRTKHNAYLNEVADGWKQEADESMKMEFKNWLQGTHSANMLNAAERTYTNDKGGVPRKWVYQDGPPGTAPGQLRSDWTHTDWGQKQLTHLPGVREWLRSQKEAESKDCFDLNMLAEHGPQDLEQAWMYFKTWVKCMPETDAKNYDLGYPGPGRDRWSGVARSKFGPAIPEISTNFVPGAEVEPRPDAIANEQYKQRLSFALEQAMTQRAAEAGALSEQQQRETQALNMTGAFVERPATGELMPDPSPNSFALLVEGGLSDSANGLDNAASILGEAIQQQADPPENTMQATEDAADQSAAAVADAEMDWLDAAEMDAVWDARWQGQPTPVPPRTLPTPVREAMPPTPAPAPAPAPAPEVRRSTRTQYPARATRSPYVDPTIRRRPYRSTN